MTRQMMLYEFDIMRVIMFAWNSKSGSMCRLFQATHPVRKVRVLTELLIEHFEQAPHLTETDSV